MAMDVFGPLSPTKAGNKYIPVVMDYTKWPEAFALRNVTSETVVNCLIEMTARTGIPEELLTDNGSNFISKTIQKYCEVTGVKQIRTSPYHPQTDGMVERFNATLKQLLKNAYHIFRGRIEEPRTDHWFLSLPPSIWSAYENATGPNGLVLAG